MTPKQKAEAKRVRMSKAQKKAWKKRKAKVFTHEVVAEPFAVTDELVQTEMSPLEIEQEDLRRSIRSWYDEALTPEDRQKRKAHIQGIMYGKEPNAMKPGAWNFAAEPLVISSNTNPKTLMGDQKVPVLSVVPSASIIAQATAMRYGAFYAPRADGKRGYGPYNWRDQPIEAHIYIDAAIRHLMQWFDGDDFEIVRDEQGRAIDEVSHLAFALATIGILLDAKANGTLIDDRPQNRQMAASHLLNIHKLARYEK